MPNQGCVITSTNTTIIVSTFIYAMCFDFTVLCLTAWKLASPRLSSKEGGGGGEIGAGMGRSKLVTMIFGDGLIYFFIAYVLSL